MNKIICISRQYASGGHEIGRQLSQYYDIPIYDKEIIAESMKSSGLSREVIENNDESVENSRTYSPVLSGFSNFAVPIVASPGDRVFQAQMKVIRELAQRGSCIFIGRCAGEILRENIDSTRIFVFADDAFRKDRAVRYYGCTDADAVNVLQKMDKKRASHFQHYSVHHWGSIDSFDLAVNTARCGIKGAVKTIISYLEHEQ